MSESQNLSARQQRKLRKQQQRAVTQQAVTPQAQAAPAVVSLPPMGAKGWALAALLLLLVAALYVKAIGYPYLLEWDDRVNVSGNPLLVLPLGEALARAWAEPYSQLYIPATYSLWALLAALFGVSDPAPFHALNILLHGGNAALVFVLLVKISPNPLFSKRGLIQGHDLEAESPLAKGGAPTARGFERGFAFALFGALLFALHPLQVEAVAWVSGMRDLLGAFFGLLALLGLVAAMAQPKGSAGFWLRYLLSALAFFLSLASKPSMVILPLIAALLAHWQSVGKEEKLWSPPKLSLILSLLPWLLLAAFWVWLTGQAQSAADLAKDLVALWQRPLVALDSFAFYLAKLFWPWPLSADYGRSPNFIAANGQIYWTWLLPTVLALVLLWRKAQGMLLAFAIFLIALLPTSGLVAFNFQLTSTVADRYAYFALFGGALAVGLGLRGVGERWRRGALATGAVLVVLCAVLSLLYLPAWSEREGFYRSILQANPKSWKAHHDYGVTLDDRGEHQACVDEIELSLRLYPDHDAAYGDLGVCYARLGQWQRAEEAMRRSLAIRASADVAKNLALILLQSGEATKAAEVYRYARRIDPAARDVTQKLIWLLATHPEARVRNGAEALELAQEWLRTVPPRDGAMLGKGQLLLAAALAEAQDFARAVVAATQAERNLRATNPAAADQVAKSIIPALERRAALRDEGLLRPLGANAEKGAAPR